VRGVLSGAYIEVEGHPAEDGCRGRAAEERSGSNKEGPPRALHARGVVRAEVPVHERHGAAGPHGDKSLIVAAKGQVMRMAASWAAHSGLPLRTSRSSGA
jgi:hypothetical protein